MTEATHAALADVTPELLAQALNLRKGHIVTGAHWDALQHLLTVRIEGPDLPIVAEGAIPDYYTSSEA